MSASAVVASRLGAAAASASPSSITGRDYFELRRYQLTAGTRLKGDASPALLDRYLEQAALPAMERMGVKNVGVFTELEINKEAATSTPKAGSPVWVLIPHTSLDSYVRVSAMLNEDPAVQKSGADYLQAPKATPAFERFDSWLLLGFTGFPHLQVPTFSRTPTRVFELRDYESHSEAKALNKIAMFNAGEIEVMKELGMSPVFYGQALSGPDLPHLRYMTGAADLATHLSNWKKFGTAPGWNKLKVMPEFQDNTSKNTARFVAPKPYSAI